MAHLVAGTSTKSVDHYAQIIRSGKFKVVELFDFIVIHGTNDMGHMLTFSS
jgi:hypothetical protein